MSKEVELTVLVLHIISYIWWNAVVGCKCVCDHRPSGGVHSCTGWHMYGKSQVGMFEFWVSDF